MLFSLLIASAGVASTAGIGSIGLGLASPIKNHCGLDGVVPNSYMVTLKTPANAHRRDLGFLNRWFRQYNPGSDRRNPTRAVHYFTHTQFAVAIEASNNVRIAQHGPTLIPTTQGPCRASVPNPDLCVILSHCPRTASAPQVAMRMATDDPAVFSVDHNCFRQFNSSIPESGDSLLGHDSPDLNDEVARRLSVQWGAPWGIDRIDTDGEPPRIAALA